MVKPTVMPVIAALADPKRAGGPVTPAFCWAHWRHIDLAKSPPAPIAVEALGFDLIESHAQSDDPGPTAGAGPACGTPSTRI